MIPPSNTPPDGDFVRYVERLTRSKPVAGTREDLLSSQASAAASISLAANSGLPSAHAGLQPLTRISFLTHVKWVAALWIATQALATLVPAAGFLFIPALALYAAWVIFTIRHKLPGNFFKCFKGTGRMPLLSEFRTDVNVINKGRAHPVAIRNRKPNHSDCIRSGITLNLE